MPKGDSTETGISKLTQVTEQKREKLANTEAARAARIAKLRKSVKDSAVQCSACVTHEGALGVVTRCSGPGSAS